MCILSLRIQLEKKHTFLPSQDFWSKSWWICRIARRASTDVILYFIVSRLWVLGIIFLLVILVCWHCPCDLFIKILQNDRDLTSKKDNQKWNFLQEIWRNFCIGRSYTSHILMMLIINVCFCNGSYLS